MKKNQFRVFYCVFVILLLGVLLAACCSSLPSPETCQANLDLQVNQFNDEYTAGASITIEKSADPKSFTAVGEVITYTYTITNNGTEPFNTLTDQSGKWITVHNTSFSVQDDKVAMTCPAVQNFKAKQKVTCTGTYTVTEQDFAQGQVVNNVSAEVTQNTTFKCLADGGCYQDYWVTQEVAYTARASTALTVLFDAQPALSLSKSADPTYHSGGRTITYTFILTNIGNVTLTPPFTIIDNRLRSNWSCEERAELLPGDTMFCQGNYFLDAGIRWTFINTAVATAYYNNQQITSNTAAAEVLYRQPFLPPPPPPPPPTTPYCGDGVVNQTWEQCDPPDGSTCDIECQNIIP
jgi:hypothetical protein